MKISLIMAACNPGPKLLSTIDSASASLQGCDYEIIVVNDLSNDGYCEQAPRWVNTINLNNRTGCSGARRVGMLEAQGDIIIICDPHCEFPNNSLQALAEHAADFDGVMQPPVNIVGHGVVRGSCVRLFQRGLMLRRRSKRYKIPYPAIHGSIYAMSRRVADKLWWIPRLPCWYGEYEVYVSLMCYRLGMMVGIVDTNTCIHDPYKRDGNRTHFTLPRGHRVVNRHWCYSVCMPNLYKTLIKPILTKRFPGVKHQRYYNESDRQSFQNTLEQSSVKSEDWVSENVLALEPGITYEESIWSNQS